VTVPLSASPVSAAPAPSAPTRQRCTLVLPSSDAYDSRSWRIASALAARGHEVTVVARRGEGQGASEAHPDGYAIVRVDVSAVGGLPRPLAALARWLRRGRDAGAGRGAGAGRPAERPDGQAANEAARRSLVGRLRSAIGAAVRLAAIALTVRSQRLASRPVAPPADLVHAMAYMGIPIGLDLGRRDGAPVVYDARDIYVDAANVARLPSPARRVFAMVERRWARRASRVITVNQPYADVMAERFGVTTPLVVMNCSYAQTGPPENGRRFHERLGLPAETRVVLYQGGLSPNRGIEQLIEALPAMGEGVALVLLGYGALHDELEARAVSPALAGRLFVLPAVPPAELVAWVGSADVVAMPIQPSTLNHRLTTPNKLFEAMAAGVPVVASDLPGMAAIVRDTGCGVLCDPTSPASVAAAVRSILEAPADERDAYRQRALAAVRAVYNWDVQMATLLSEYERLTGRAW
jgi:glycosyltransferase involved in cell wall biosynthesis